MASQILTGVWTYGVLAPRKVDGLLVPAACSASHVGYQVLRMEPVLMALGEASGVAAHVALRNGVPVRGVPFDHPAFAALQWLGARGFNLGYRGEPDQRPSKRAAAERLQRVFRTEGKAWTIPDASADKSVLEKEAIGWLREVGLEPSGREATQLEERELNTVQIAVLVYGAFRKGSASK